MSLLRTTRLLGKASGHRPRPQFFVLSLLVALALTAVVQIADAQSIAGPFLGFTRDASGSTIRPIIGVPGAAALSAQLQFEADIRGAVISPAQDYAIAVRSDDGTAVLLRLKDASSTLFPISGIHANP